MGEREQEEKEGIEGRRALQMGAPVEKALLQSLASGVGRGQTRPRANLPKSGHAEGGRCMEDGPAEPAVITARQTPRKNTGPWLQPQCHCLTLQPRSSSHLPRILRFPLETAPHSGHQGDREQGMCCSQSPFDEVPDSGSRVPSGLACTAQQAKSGFSCSQTLS